MLLKAKRTVSVFVAAFIILSAVSVGFTVAAASQPVFSVGGAARLHPGDRFSVAVSVNESRGYCAGEFVIKFDEDALTPVNITPGDAASDYFAGNPDYADGKVFFAVISPELMKDAGTIATVDFVVNAGVVLYSGELELEVNSLVGDVSVGYGLNSVKSTANSSKIYAAKRLFVPEVSGDANEELEVLQGLGGAVLTATTTKNMSCTNLGANFANLDVSYFAKDGSSLRKEQRLTTGCKIKLFENGRQVNTMTVAVKADVNGDYSRDGEDAFIAGLISAGLIDAAAVETSISIAADANGDGVVDQSDVEIIEDLGLRVSE